ncbi:GTPase-activating protein GYP5 [Phytophthora cinnamomi]|uniref:GTPase-activating protein GYP5 n=1 Tax=Phytophthora cinnamomi TaxID=4785 RepID=UPI003559799A|nr:GTPase-activating protein GYP5 [Phytophthora cinnamomi]
METSVVAPVASAPAADMASPASSSPASSSGGEEPPSHKLPPAAPVLKPLDPASDEDAGDAPTATGSGAAAHSLAGAFGLMKDRAATAKKTLGPQLLNMKDMTSKKLEKYQPTIVKAKTSATAGLTTAASRMKEGSTQGWSMLKTKLAAAGPVAERIHTMGLNVMTDIYLGDTTVEGLVGVEDPRSASCLFLEKYRAAHLPADSPSRAKGLLRMTRAISNSSTHSVENETAPATAADQCFATPYVLGNILLFCGDLPVLARVSCVNKACRDFIASERRLEKFCVRYGHLPPSIRFAYWEKTTRVRKTREASELDYDTYLQMALSKGDATELIMTDVRRTYGRVAPHKRAANHKDEVSEEDLTTQLSEILHALAGRFPAVGYCQGMDYIAAHVLNKVKKSGSAADTKAEAESTFWLLVTLFERYGLHDMFAPGLHTLHVHCFQTQRLLELTEPALAEHFAHEKVPIEMFAVGWFQTLYLYLNVLPADSLDRIWDIFLYERNWKIMLRVAVAILQLSSEFVMEKPIDEIMQFFNTFADQADELLAETPLTQRALRLKVTNTVLTKLQKQHIKAKRASPTKTQTFS